MAYAVRPMLRRPVVRIAEEPFELAKAAANTFVAAAKESVQEKGKFFAALSGGSTPRAMHRLLAEELFCLEVPWSDIHLFWVDDRCVPYANPASNFGVAREDFLNRVPVSPGQIHPMPIHFLPEEGAVQSFNRKRFEVDDPPYEIIGQTSRPDARVEQLFERRGRFMRAWGTVREGGEFEEPLKSYYEAHPEVLELDRINV